MISFSFMPDIQVKICGIRDLEIGKYCIDLGVDYLGINISPKSKRNVSIQNAIELITKLKQYSQTTKLVLLAFENKQEEIQTLTNSAPIDYLQYVTRDLSIDINILGTYHIPLIPQIGVKSEISDSDLPNYGLMILDSYHEKEGGGTGSTFPWEYLRKIKKNYFLAGGLNPDNVAIAVKELSSFGVDVASGVESSPGVKDKDLIRKFIKNAKSG